MTPPRILVLILVLAAAVGAAAPALASRGNPVRGRALAVEACAACHKVTAHQRRPAPVADPDAGESVAAPTFAAIARKYAYDGAALRAFILAPGHPMREQRFLSRDLSDIVAYIRSLHRH